MLGNVVNPVILTFIWGYIASKYYFFRCRLDVPDIALLFTAGADSQDPRNGVTPVRIDTFAAEAGLVRTQGKNVDNLYNTCDKSVNTNTILEFWCYS